MDLPCDPAISLPGIYTKETNPAHRRENILEEKYTKRQTPHAFSYVETKMSGYEHRLEA